MFISSELKRFPVNVLDGSSDRILKFTVSTPLRQCVKFAELGLYKISSALQTPHNSTITIHIVDIHSGIQIASQRVAKETIDWISFAIPRHIIRRWSRKPLSNAGIFVKVNERNMTDVVRFATRQKNATFQPILVVHCIDKASIFSERRTFSRGIKPVHRISRSLHPSHAGKCQIHNLTVYFKDLGWDEWVIAPKMYSANYCAGTCLDLHDTKRMSHHAFVQLLVHEKDSSYAHAPCCAPSHMSSISMLYIGEPGESNFVLKTMENFVVRSCVCR